MAELVARGPEPAQHWRRTLTDGGTTLLGRGEPEGGADWERALSRRHAEMTWQGGRLRVHRLPTALNPIMHRGEDADSFQIGPGESFVVGRTRFTLEGETSTDSPDARTVVHSWAVSAPELRKVSYRDAPHRIEALRGLTDVIASASDDDELFDHLTSLLLSGIRRADAVALVAATPDASVRTLHAESRLAGAGEFRPSHRLVREAVLKLRDSVVHVWAGGDREDDQEFTLGGNFDWAFCTPVPGDACKGWGLYAAGALAGSVAAGDFAAQSRDELAEDVKFAELVASILCSLRQLKSLQKRQSLLGHFFSPEVLRVLGDSDPESRLTPRETEITALFCDLRGFSQKVEMSADNLMSILERVGKALGVMTQSIFEQHGVVADFQGDSALGFWGWPLEQADRVKQACLAALGIRKTFTTFAGRPDHPLSGFRAGIGIASGRAVAGRIGTVDQSKITVFGPVVNLASRLEGLTKILHVPILVDETTAQAVRATIPPEVARLRRLAQVRPYGLESALTVSELLPPAAEDPVLSDENVRDYEAALDAFLKGDWSAAYEKLHRVPPQDLGKDFLLGHIIQHNHTPPPGWDGIITLSVKH